jgi:hypothetical protein
MSASPTSLESNPNEPERSAGGDAPSAAAPAPAWVRHTAAVLVVVPAAVAILLVAQYVRTHASLAAAPNTPSLGAAIVLAVIAAMAAAVLVFRPESGERRALVATSVAWTLTLLLALTVAWDSIAVSTRQNEPHGWRGTPVFAAAAADAYLDRHVSPGLHPIKIPTGILIKSMEFLSGDNVQVSGFIWQRFGPDVPKDFDRGVVVVEAVKEAYDSKQVYQYEENGVETIGWYFWATLRQPFEYAEYPFDEQDLWFRLWSRDFAHDVILIPDFASYRTMDPSALPGIESEFVYSGWTPVYSGFSYADLGYDTSFGIGDAGEYADLPELYFNFVLDRNFAGPFFDHLIFAIAVAFLLFGVLILTTSDPDLKDRFQLSTSSVLLASSGLLFAVILKHNQLRTIIDAQGISYIEVIPILLYLVIIFVVLNAILLASPVHVRILEYRNNALPVLAYWPVLLGVVLAVTLIVFYRN